MVLGRIGLVIALMVRCEANVNATLTCSVKKNTDVAVTHYKRTPAKTVAECCAACEADPKCKVAVFHIDHCNLKDQLRFVPSSSDFVSVLPGESPPPIPAPTPSPHPPSPSPKACSVKKNMDVAVTHYKRTMAKSAAECCDACAADPRCRVAVFHIDHCNLKDQLRLVPASSDFVTVLPGESPSPGPSPGPYPPVARTPRGCGVAIGGDWPNCGRKFSTDYDFDLTALMKSAQDVAKHELWRYDWRATEHPVSGPWTYVAMDWCWKRDERPNPADESPGLMSWNEPNVPGQCNVDAADPRGIQEFVNLAREYKQRGKFVVSPAPGDGTGWLDTFLGECKDSGFVGVDYIAYHHYVSCNADTSGDGMYWEMHAMLQRHIDLMYKWNDRGFDIKGVWITEIACAPSGGWGNRPYHWEHDKPALLMDKFIDIINNHQELQAWAWFGYGGFGNLWERDSSALTDLGHKYFSNCHGDREPVQLRDMHSSASSVSNTSNAVVIV